MFLTEFNEVFGGELAAPIGMKDHSSLASTACNSLGQRIDGKLCVDTLAVYTGNDTAIEQVDDAAVVSLAVIGKEKVREVDAPARIPFVCIKALIQQVFKDRIGLRSFGIAVFGLSCHRFKPKLHIHIFANRLRAEADSFVSKELFHHAIAGLSA